MADTAQGAPVFGKREGFKMELAVMEIPEGAKIAVMIFVHCPDGSMHLMTSDKEVLGTLTADDAGGLFFTSERFKPFVFMAGKQHVHAMLEGKGALVVDMQDQVIDCSVRLH